MQGSRNFTAGGMFAFQGCSTIIPRDVLSASPVTQTPYFIALSIILEFFFTSLIFNAIPSVKVLVLIQWRKAAGLV
jgi:hypothetical protein